MGAKLAKLRAASRFCVFYFIKFLAVCQGGLRPKTRVVKPEEIFVVRKWAKKPFFCARSAGMLKKPGFWAWVNCCKKCKSSGCPSKMGAVTVLGQKCLFPDVGKMVGPRVLRDAVRVLGAVPVPAGFVTVAGPYPTSVFNVGNNY